MTVAQSIKPLNIAAATLLVQLILIALLAITTSLYASSMWAWKNRDDRSLDERSAPNPLSLRRSPTLLIAIITFAILLISDDLYGIWSPLFQGVGINTISTLSAISVVFVLDLILVGYLMFNSGGSMASPFLPALLTIPALAIFLRLPPVMFFAFAGIAAVIYLLLLPVYLGASRSYPAAAFMTISCLLLSMFTGYITRPVPIDRLNQREDLVPQSQPLRRQTHPVESHLTAKQPAAERGGR